MIECHALCFLRSAVCSLVYSSLYKGCLSLFYKQEKWAQRHHIMELAPVCQVFSWVHGPCTHICMLILVYFSGDKDHTFTEVSEVTCDMVSPPELRDFACFYLNLDINV